MPTKERYTRRSTALLMALLSVIAVAGHYQLDPWGFYWKRPEEEEIRRMQVVETAENYLGHNEADGRHMEIVNLYNSHTPLAVDYIVTETDSWCAAFVSAVAIRLGITDIIPTECGCQRQIGLFQNLGRWDEQDNAIPLPGDIIYYDWDAKLFDDCVGWSDHVGIVVGTKWPFIKVIEGNKNDSVSYRYLLIGDYRIRGYARPDYTQ